MTITTIVSIVAAVVFGTFCVLCIRGLSGSRKDIKENSAKVENIEKSVGGVGEIVAQKTDFIARKIDEQEIRQIEMEKQIRDLAEQMAMVRQTTPNIQENSIETIDDEIDLDDLLAELGAAESNENVQPYGDIPSEPEIMPARQPEIMPARQPEIMPAQQPEIMPAPTTEDMRKILAAQNPVQEEENRGYIGYNIGKSGKRYTPAELNKLIKE